MSDYLVILLVGCLGLLGAGWWVIPIGAVGLSIEPWFLQWKMLEDRRVVPYNWSTASFFAASFGSGFIACGASYLAGLLGMTALRLID